LVRHTLLHALIRLDLTISKISLNDRKNVIKRHCGLMPAFGNRLSGQKAEMQKAYTMTLKRN